MCYGTSGRFSSGLQVDHLRRVGFSLRAHWEELMEILGIAEESQCQTTSTWSSALQTTGKISISFETSTAGSHHWESSPTSSVSYLLSGRTVSLIDLADVTHREIDAPITASPNNFDNLDKAFVILKLPGPGRLHRRVDLISAPKNRYAAAVLSWSGSMMFERDLRWASRVPNLEARQLTS